MRVPLGRAVLSFVTLVGLAAFSVPTWSGESYPHRHGASGASGSVPVSADTVNVMVSAPQQVTGGWSATVSITPVSGCTVFEVDFDDGAPGDSLLVSTPPWNHVWSSPKVYNIHVRGQGSGAPGYCDQQTGWATLKVGDFEQVQLTKGEWSRRISWARIPIHMSLLPNGKVLAWDEDSDTANNTQTWIWDPENSNPSNATTLENSCVLFCAGHAFMADGRLLVAGGGHGSDSGISATNIFDFSQGAAGSWTTGPLMTNGRWYPTVTALATGELLITAGDMKPAGQSVIVNPTPEVVSVDGTTKRELSQASRSYDNWFPLLFAAPNGKVFDVSQWPNGSGNLDPSANNGAGSWTSVVAPKIDDFSGNRRWYASAVLYDSDPVNNSAKVLLTGGGTGTGGCAPENYQLGKDVTNDAEFIELDDSPSWQQASPMKNKRQYHNSTVLADGTVLVSGGFGTNVEDPNAFGVLSAEIWNPAANPPSWTEVASVKHRRVYHSTALLLPDGRVLAGGGRAGSGCSYPDVQIYSPPYFFKNRPVISSAPLVIGYGENFFVGTSANIQRVHLIRLGSVTHAFDQNQRLTRLQFASADGGLNVTAPASGSQAPPGHYMLIIVDNTGVPSVSKIIRVAVANSGTLGSFGKTSPANGATQLPTSLTLSWGASSGATSYEYCLDTSHDNVCNSVNGWVSTGPNTSVVVTGLDNTKTYSWQVRANKGAVTSYADGAPQTFWSLAPVGLPFGQVDTPAQNATGVQGAIGVTGWALDEVHVTKVEIFRNCLAFEPQNCQTVLGNSVVYLGDAAFITGARSDVAAAFPTYPDKNSAGWGFSLLTPMLPHVPNSLPYGGQGALTLYAIATDTSSNKKLLGRSWVQAHSTYSTPTAITMSNDTIAKPFGIIDTPSQGQTISGMFNNFGWAITPDANTTGGESNDIVIPTNGSTMTVFIDGLPVGLVAYNQCRGNVGNPVPGGVYCNDDIASFFGNATPQAPLTTRTSNPTKFRNLDAARAAIGVYTFDSTALSNGLHTIAWSVSDSSGRNEGIGSRFFTVANSGPAYRDRGTPQSTPALSDGASLPDRAPLAKGVWGRTGYDLAARWTKINAKADGSFAARLNELDRLELSLGSSVDAGYLVANGKRHPLPLGASLSGATFGWMPPAGYIGPYHLVFVRDDEQIDVTVTISAKQRPRRVGR